MDCYIYICYSGIARASSETDEHGYDIIYAQPIPNAELKAPIPCQCNSSRYFLAFVYKIE